MLQNLSDIDLEFYDSLPAEDKEEWLFERSACDASLHYFVTQVGSFSLKAGGDISPHIHKRLCDFYQDDTIKRKAIYIPRDWLKSTTLSKWGNLWRYLQNNEVRILMPSQRIDLTSSFIKTIKRWAKTNPRLRWLYPVLHQINREYISAKRSDGVPWGATDAEFPRLGHYSEPTFRAIGITGGAQGGHYDHVQPDDIVSEKGMKSRLVLEDALRWIDNAEELLDNPSESTLVYVGTHWGPGDAGQYIQEKYKEYKWMITPALKDSSLRDTENITWVQNEDSANGESNWPEMFPTKHYVDMQANPEKRAVFWSQHMNNPRLDELVTFDSTWLKFYRIEEKDGYKWIVCEDDKERIRVGSFPVYGLIDPGGFSLNRMSKGGSRSAIIVGGQPAGSHKKFIMYSWAGRFQDPTKFLDEIFKAYDETRPYMFRQEIFGQQRYILEDIKKEAKIRKVPLRIMELESDERKDAKDINIRACIQPMRNGEIYVHQTMKSLIGEIQTYPNGMTKDLVDLMGKLNQHYWKRGTRPEPSKSSSDQDERIIEEGNITGY